MALLTLPEELLSHILTFLPPADLVNFGKCCHAALSFIAPENQLLWRCAFLHMFDNPHDAWSLHTPSARPARPDEWDWYHQLRRRLSTLQAVRGEYNFGSTKDGLSQWEDHLSVVLSILDTAKFGPTDLDRSVGIRPCLDDRSSLNLQILAYRRDHQRGLETLIHDAGQISTSFYSGADGNPWNSPRRPFTRSMAFDQLEKHRPADASRLHVLYGITVRERLENRSRGVARRKVYDWSRSGNDTDYGPFNRDCSGAVDWDLLEGICSVIGRNFELCVDGHIAVPQNLCYSIPHRTPDPTVQEDWARVTGSWLGTYSFLDYADLFAFNTWNTQLGPRPSLDEESEACGDLMKLDLRLDNSLASDPRLQTALPVCTDLPPLYFRGFSHAHSGMHRPVIGVRGCVSLIPGGREVRWRFLISYGGEDQWQLEGVQPGGIRSGGVYGLWSQCDHVESGPVGPFCYFPTELLMSFAESRMFMTAENRSDGMWGFL